MIDIEIKGGKELQVYFEGVKKRIKKEVPALAYRTAVKTRDNIKGTIKIAQQYIGRYHEDTGTGLADSLRVLKVKKSEYTVAPDPALDAISSAGSGSRGGKGFIAPPKAYAEWVEYGNGKSRPKHYFEKGLRKTLKTLDRESSKTIRKIIR